MISLLPVRKALATHLAMHWFLTGVKLLNMESQVCLPATGCGTQFTLIHWLVSCVDGSVCFQTVALSEPCMTYVTLIGFLTWKQVGLVLTKL